MVSQDLKDNSEPERKRTEVGVRLAEDDLTVGDYVCVLSLKKQPNQGAPIMWQSMHVKAICLPYFVAQLLSDPQEPTLTLDCRYLNLMRVDEAFVKAQREGAKGEQMPPDMPLMAVPPKRKKQQ